MASTSTQADQPYFFFFSFFLLLSPLRMHPSRRVNLLIDASAGASGVHNEVLLPQERYVLDKEAHPLPEFVMDCWRIVEGGKEAWGLTGTMDDGRGRSRRKVTELGDWSPSDAYTSLAVLGERRGKGSGSCNCCATPMVPLLRRGWPRRLGQSTHNEVAMATRDGDTLESTPVPLSPPVSRTSTYSASCRPWGRRRVTIRRYEVMM